MDSLPHPGPDDQSPTSLDSQQDKIAVWHNLILSVHLMETALEKQSQRDGGISHGHFKLLVMLSGAPDQRLPLRSLAHTLRYSNSRISHALGTLEKQGLIIREAKEGGRRAYHARLTNQGRLLVGKVLRGQRSEIRDPLFEHLGEADSVALGNLSGRVIEFIEDLPTESLSE